MVFATLGLMMNPPYERIFGCAMKKRRVKRSSPCRLLVIGLCLLVGWGCGSGIRLSHEEESGEESEEESGETARSSGSLPGFPSIPIVTAGSGASAKVVQSQGLNVLVRVTPTPFRGQTGGEGIQVTDPFFESGIEKIGRGGEK